MGTVLVTLMVLPAILTVAEKRMFKTAKAPRSVGCNCAFCIIVSIAAVVLVALNLHQYWHLGWTGLAVVGVVVVPLMALSCSLMSRRQACRAMETQTEKDASLDEGGAS